MKQKLGDGDALYLGQTGEIEVYYTVSFWQSLEEGRDATIANIEKAQKDPSSVLHKLDLGKIDQLANLNDAG